MKFIWHGKSISGQTAHQGTDKALDIRLIPGQEFEIPDDDESLKGWCDRHLLSGKITRVEQPKTSTKTATKTEVKA